MSPKDKSEEIFNNIRLIYPKSSKVKIKTTCLTMIDYTVKSTFSINTYNKWEIIVDESLTTEYWQEVKKEINNL